MTLLTLLMLACLVFLVTNLIVAAIDGFRSPETRDERELW